MARKMSKATATKLFKELKDALLNLDEVLDKIIKNKAWEPLGYDSLIEAWESELSDVKLSDSMSARVVYALLDEGEDKTDIALAVKGVGPAKVKHLEEAKSKNLNPKQGAEYAKKMLHKPVPVRSYERNTPSLADAVHIDNLDPEQLVVWKKYAAESGQAWPDLVKEALIMGMGVVMSGVRIAA